MFILLLGVHIALTLNFSSAWVERFGCDTSWKPSCFAIFTSPKTSQSVCQLIIGIFFEFLSLAPRHRSLITVLAAFGIFFCACRSKSFYRSWFRRDLELRRLGYHYVIVSPWMCDFSLAYFHFLKLCNRYEKYFGMLLTWLHTRRHIEPGMQNFAHTIEPTWLVIKANLPAVTKKEHEKRCNHLGCLLWYSKTYLSGKKRDELQHWCVEHQAA